MSGDLCACCPQACYWPVLLLSQERPWSQQVTRTLGPDWVTKTGLEVSDKLRSNNVTSLSGHVYSELCLPVTLNTHCAWAPTPATSALSRGGQDCPDTSALVLTGGPGPR